MQHLPRQIAWGYRYSVVAETVGKGMLLAMGMDMLCGCQKPK